MTTIKIIINNRRKVFAIKHEFGRFFPGLKLEFFLKPHTSDGSHSGKIAEVESMTLADCRTIGTTGTITISSEMTVSELKDCFRDVYGLKTEVFRKFANGWVRVEDPEPLSPRERSTDLIF